MKINIEQKVDGNGKYWYELSKRDLYFFKVYYGKVVRSCWGLRKNEEIGYFTIYKYSTFEEAQEQAKKLIVEYLSTQIKTVSNFTIDDTSVV